MTPTENCVTALEAKLSHPFGRKQGRDAGQDRAWRVDFR